MSKYYNDIMITTVPLPPILPRMFNCSSREVIFKPHELEMAEAPYFAGAQLAHFEKAIRKRLFLSRDERKETQNITQPSTTSGLISRFTAS